MTMEINNVQTLGDTRRPREFQNSNKKLIQNDFGNIIISWIQTCTHGNLFGIPEMAVEIYNVIFSQTQFDNLLVPQTWQQMIKVTLLFFSFLFKFCNPKGIPVTIRRIRKGSNDINTD